MPRRCVYGQCDEPGQSLRNEIIHRNDRAENQAKSDSGQRHFVGQKLSFSVGEDQSEKKKSERRVLQGRERKPEVRVAGEKEKSGEQLDDEISRRDLGLTAPATAAEQEPAQDWNVVVKGDLLVASWAGGVRMDDGHPLR